MRKFSKKLLNEDIQRSITFLIEEFGFYYLSGSSQIIPVYKDIVKSGRDDTLETVAEAYGKFIQLLQLVMNYDLDICCSPDSCSLKRIKAPYMRYVKNAS